MTPDTWFRVKRIFSAALEEPRESRRYFAERACAGDPGLLREVRRLLEASEDGSSFHPAIEGLEQPQAAPAAPRFAPGTLLARRFRIIQFLARGGMGEVYEAQDQELGAHVALKLIRPEIAQDASALAAFKREIHLARQVTHPNVCRFTIWPNTESRGSRRRICCLWNSFQGRLSRCI